MAIYYKGKKLSEATAVFITGGGSGTAENISITINENDKTIDIVTGATITTNDDGTINIVVGVN